MAKGKPNLVARGLLVAACAASCLCLCACAADDHAATGVAPSDRFSFAETVDDRPLREGSDRDHSIRGVGSGETGGPGSMLHKATGVVESVDRGREIVVITVTSGSDYVLGQTITFDFSKHQGLIYEIDEVAEGDIVNVEFLFGPGQSGMRAGEGLEIA